MGWNATVVVMIDSLGDIERDPEFGKKLAAAIRQLDIRDKPVDISAMGSVNAATAIEKHHSNSLVPVLVGGNTGMKLDIHLSPPDWWKEAQVELALSQKPAEKHGSVLHKKPVRKK